MRSCLRDRLCEFIRERVSMAGKTGEELHDSTSLIRSQLLDSLALLHLAAWVEDEVGAPLDLSYLDPAAEWDTVADIERFIETHR